MEEDVSFTTQRTKRKEVMGTIATGLLGSYWWVLVLAAVIILHRVILRVFLGMVMVSEDEMGIVNKKWALFGKNTTLPDGAIIALNGEAGLQADTLAPGVHFWLFPWQFSVERVKFTTVGDGMIGIVEARDGIPLSRGRVLAKTVECNSFQDARSFLANGGERGPQISIIPPGTYRINTALFKVTDVKVLEIRDGMVGVVTTKDGKPLATGEIAGKEMPGHNMFQDAEKFITAGGYKGMQEQVILAGRYFINPMFATVEEKPMTSVPIANVGVVISYVGEAGEDVTGASFKHGNLVKKGQKGVWVEPLDPGKYPVNPYTHKVEIVSTANVVLNWADDKSEAHKLDENLCTITVRSSDGFKFNLDVSQIIHVPSTAAPKVIARFGTMGNLVTQVLEPIIGNYFRNAAQYKDVIAFLSERKQRQDEAKEAIRAALAEYDVGAIDTLIGDIVPPEALMQTLMDRKIAQQQQLTFETQQTAEDTRAKLEQSRAMATTQAGVVNAQRTVEIKEFEAKAAVAQAKGAAESKTINVAADAAVIEQIGAAEAKKTLAIGEAEATVIKQKIESMDAGNYAAVQIAQALAQNHIKLVPDIMVSGGSQDGKAGGGTLVDVLLAGVIRDSMTKKNDGPTAEQTPPAAPAIK